METNNDTTKRYTIDLSFQEIKLPPFRDILVLGKDYPQGKIGLSKSFEMLIPDGFDIIEVDNERIDAVFVNKRILVKIPRKKILHILESKVFPLVSKGELIRVDFSISVEYSKIEMED